MTGPGDPARPSSPDHSQTMWKSAACRLATATFFRRTVLPASAFLFLPRELTQNRSDCDVDKHEEKGKQGKCEADAAVH